MRYWPTGWRCGACGRDSTDSPTAAAVFHILIALADRERHGYSIKQDVAARTESKVQLSAGTLYSFIRRMLEQGLIEELAESPDTRRCRRSRLKAGCSQDWLPHIAANGTGVSPAL